MIDSDISYMIYNNIEYKVKFFKDSKNNSPVSEYINGLDVSS